MSAFQWFHVNSYSRQLSKKAKHAKWNAADVVAEATRDPGAIPHVNNPEPPTHIYGKSMGQLLTTLDEWAERTLDGTGKRKMRKDAVCLLAGVFSMPKGTPEDEWQKVKDDNVAYLVKKYGARLQTVIEHTDEKNPHCHFYVVPLPGEEFEAIHEGRRAVKDFVAAGGNKKKTNDVYRGAMRLVQDEYYREVAAKNGMLRVGPAKRRLSRPEWYAEQARAAAIKSQMDLAEAMVREATTLATDTAEQGEALKKEASERSEAIQLEALADADRLREEAIAHGFEDGLGQFEKLPWWKKAGAFLSSVVRERDQLKAELAAEKTETAKLRQSLKTMGEKLAAAIKKGQGYFESGKKFRDLFRDAEPKAAIADRLSLENAELKLEAKAKAGLTEHLVAVSDALKEENQDLIETLEREREERRLELLAMTKNGPEPGTFAPGEK